MARPRSFPSFRERYAVLLDIGRNLTATLRPDELYRTIYEQASRVLETTGFFISLYDADRDEAQVVFYADRGLIERPGTTYRGSESIAIREARPVLQQKDEPDQAIMLLGPESDEEVTRSLIAVPILRDGQVLGVLSAQSYHDGAYSHDDVELLTAIADLAAVALENARFVAETDRRRREAERLEELGRALTSSLELSEVLRRIIGATRDLMNADGAGVWLLRGDVLQLATAEGERTLPPGIEVPLPADVKRQMLEAQRAVVFDLGESHPLIPEELRSLLDKKTGAAVPLIGQGEMVGALSVSHDDELRYTPEDLRLLERLGYQAAIAVANARLHERIRLLSLTDPLTELPNRRQLGIFLQKEFAAAQRGRKLTVVLFDLDDFKSYNDAAGHQAGDDALRAFARVLQSETRAMNLAARYGGDEFMCILSDTDHEGGVSQAMRVIRAVKKHPLIGRIGVSAGVATYSEEMESADALIRAADRDLYGSKSRRDARIPL